MKTYQERKAEVKQEAIKWQLNFVNHNYSYGELACFSRYFEKLAKLTRKRKELKQ